MTAEAPVLALRGVSRRFGEGATAVSAVRRASLRVLAGETVAVMGPSGSGKSTLLCIMGGLLAPDAGEAAIAGRPLGALSAAERARLRRRLVGFVFQRFNLLKALTALENVALGLHFAGVPGVEARARRALDEVGLGARARALPRDLSGGEQQRVAVARALAPAPALILADEPTGSLDSANGRLVIEMIREHAHRRRAAAVIVTHDQRVGAAVDRLLRMEDGVLEDPDGAALA